ncbi:MAG: MerR family transcriptional regulator [Chitinophagaceae bacterium]|nr:MerR family transcriptional regulator [Chitinophagaceae bacterium]
MNSFSIKDLENLTGIKAHTLRIWEQRYNFLKPKRTETNIRYYTNDELKLLLNVSLLNRYGYKISQISRMRPDELSEKINLLTDPKAAQEKVIHQLVQTMVDFDADGFERVLNRQILLRGAEKTFTEILFPFLEKIGILWQTGNIMPAQEHVVSNIIRQKLISAIDQLPPVKQNEKPIILFLPEDEFHELGLLFANYLMKKRGIKTLYLGANVPLEDVFAVCEIMKPSYLYTHITSTGSDFNTDKFLNSIAKILSPYKIVMSGSVTSSYKKEISPNIQFKKSLREVIEFINNL